MKLGSLFAGIGGFDLAARWMGWETAWVSEIDPYASAVLKRHWPNAPNLGDITTITEAPPIDMLVGGFPCQDISLAGKGAGLEGSRSGLWFHYARLIDTLRPRWVVAENVSALRSRGLDQVLRSLDALGYDAEWHCIPAAYVGAPHRRDRIWIVAYPHVLQGDYLFAGCGAAGSTAVAPAGSVDPLDADRSGDGARSSDVADTDRTGLEEQRRTGGVSPQFHPAERRGEDRPEADAVHDALRGGCEGHLWRWDDPLLTDGRWWSTEPDVGRVANGVPARVDRLRCLGNAIVPQVAYLIFQAIERAEVAAR